MATKTKSSKVTEVNLELNQVQAASIRQTKTASKITLEFAEKMRNPQAEQNVLARMNAGDARFNSEPSVRRAWLTIEKKNAVLLGIPDEAIKAAEKAGPDGLIELGDEFKNPTMDLEGKPEALCIQLNDTHTPTEFQAENILDTAKQGLDKNGNQFYFVKDGKFIFQNSTVVFKKHRKHAIINSDKRISREEAEQLISSGTAVQGASAAETLNS